MESESDRKALEKRKKKGRWLQDKAVLDGDLFKYYKDENGFYKYLTEENCKIANVLIENADRWIDERNKQIKKNDNQIIKDASKVFSRKAAEQIILQKLKLPENDLKNILEIKFDYDKYKPEKEIETLEELREVIVKYFPSVWVEVEACLSVAASLSLKNLNGCPSLNLVGNPSGEKTTVLSFFYGHSNTYLSDDFTPRAFVSHAVNVNKEELENIDLLPKIKNKVLISPELAPLFEAPKDKLLDNFAILTRVLDGEGLNRDTGSCGHRGYSGDYKFAWLGATTPLRASVWNIMGKIGNRLFFLNMSEKNRSDEDYLKMFSEQEYQEKVMTCRGAVLNFLDNHFKKYPIRSLEWNNKDDVFILPDIIKYAKLLSKCRGTLMTWKSEEKGEYEYNFPIIEEPPRAINSLYNIAKGHALINGRTFLKSEDKEIPRRVCFSSMPHDRNEFLKLLMKHEGKLTTDIIEKELLCSKDTALRTMKIFEILGVVEVKNLPIGYGRPLKYVEIKPEFLELLKHTQVENFAINSKSQENNTISDDYDNLKSEDFL